MLHAPFNLGIGGAVQLGFVYAMENGYDFMVQVDADGQHDPREIPPWWRRWSSIPSWTWCAGRAFCPTAASTRRRSSRRTGIHLFAFLMSRIVGQRVSDPTSGFRLYNRRSIALFARDYPHDYPEVEAVLMLHHHRLRMREVPVRMFAARVARPRSAPASRRTTWSRCCWRSSSAWPAAVPPLSPETPRPSPPTQSI